MKIKGLCVIFSLIFLLNVIGCINPRNNEVETISTESVTQIPPAPFENQIRIEIENKRYSGVTLVSYWLNETNITYDENSKTLLVDITQKSVWNLKYLNTILFDATFHVMQVAVKHPDKITNVTIVGRTMLMDAQGHEYISEVY